MKKSAILSIAALIGVGAMSVAVAQSSASNSATMTNGSSTSASAAPATTMPATATTAATTVTNSSVMTYGPTKEGDTLWKLSRHHPHGVGRFQMMEAIQNMNPSAFKGSHESVLRTGVMLQIPTTKAEVMKYQNLTPKGTEMSPSVSSNSAATSHSMASGTAMSNGMPANS